MPLKRTYLHQIILVAAVCAAFGGCLANGFVWDDILLMVNNPVYRTFDLHRMLFSLGNGVEYLPVRDISFALDWRLWGDSPIGFHLTNLLLYCANVSAVYFLVRAMVRRFRPDDVKGAESAALVTALLFALHPLHVESVAFITCRNVLLSGLFSFLSLLLFLKLAERPERSAAFGAGSLALFVLAILSKATAIVLPILLPVCLLPLDRVRRQRLAAWTTPYFALAGIAFVLFRAIALSTNVIRETAATTAAGTTAVALQIPFFYLKKLLLPTGLSSEYAEVFPQALTAPATLLATGVLILLALAAWLMRRRCPFLLSGLLWFLVTLLPALHFFPTYPVVADRYAYLPVLGLCLAIGVPVGLAAQSRLRSSAVSLAVILALGWGTLTFLRVPVWKTEESLWENVIRNYPNHVKAYASLGALYFQKGDLDRAFALFMHARDLDPRSPLYDYFQGYLKYKAGSYADALVHLDRAVDRNGQFIMALYDEGLTHEKLGDREQAIAWFRRVLASTDADPLGFYKNAARRHLQQLGAEATR